MTYEVVNLTPHDVQVIAPDQAPVLFVATGTVARVREVASASVDTVTSRGTVPVTSLTYADSVDGLPEPRPGVLYLVSRVTAAASDRGDLVFPHGELRDERGQIIGCAALGRFAAPDVTNA